MASKQDSMRSFMATVETYNRVIAYSVYTSAGMNSPYKAMLHVRSLLKGGFDAGGNLDKVGLQDSFEEATIHCFGL